MKNRILELSNELSKMILESEIFSGYVSVTKFEDGGFMLQITHYHDYYRYNNSHISIYDFSDENSFKEFKIQAIDCIENGTLLKDLGAL